MTVASALLLTVSILLSVPALSQSGQAQETAAKGDLLVSRARIDGAPRYLVVETRGRGMSVLERVPIGPPGRRDRVARIRLGLPETFDR
jgi:hypothetical protein